jgi:hypothetical protein
LALRLPGDGQASQRMKIMNAPEGLNERPNQFLSHLPAIALAGAVAFGLFLPGRAWAQEQGTYGVVGFIDGASENGFAFRLVGQPDLCAGPGTLRGYGNIRLGDYGNTQEKIKYMLAMVIAAKLSSTPVWVYASLSPNGVDCAVRAIVW